VKGQRSEETAEWSVRKQVEVGSIVMVDELHPTIGWRRQRRRGVVAQCSASAATLSEEQKSL
jgi:hypothetical protein